MPKNVIKEFDVEYVLVLVPLVTPPPNTRILRDIANALSKTDKYEYMKPDFGSCLYLRRKKILKVK